MSCTAIVGPSGTGKSTSYGEFPELGIKGLNSKKTVVVNVTGKDLPFRGWKKRYSGKPSEGGNYYEGSDTDVITKLINYVSDSRPDIENLIIDDAQYLMAFEFMRRAKESGYGKFADMGVNMSKVLEAARKSRLKVFLLWHPEVSNEGIMKMRTVGKMVDDYLCVEGLVTVILYSKVSKGVDSKPAYEFVTNNDGQYPAKSPIGMFSDTYIKNDLGIVAELIDKYNNGE